MDSNSNQSTSEDSSLYQAIKENNMEEIKLLFNDGRNLNNPVVTTGPFAGYTALHVACMENNDELVDLLVKEYKVDVNVVAEDGTQPIHLACFYEPVDDKFKSEMRKLRSLLGANANANAELDQEMFSKHVKDCEWCPDFGDKITLGTYTVISNKHYLTASFADFEANLDIKSLTNKTLLMYIIERGHWRSVGYVINNCKDPEYLNHRDNDGIPATHYLFHPKKFEKCRYNISDLFGLMNGQKGQALLELSYAGADMFALLDNDPATFIPNIAAYRGCSTTLGDILPEYSSISMSKALYYATLPMSENIDDDVHMDDDDNDPLYLNGLQAQREECVEFILKDLINRITFGSPVPEGEKQLMDKLIATDTKIKNIVDNYQTEFIEGELKSKFIELNDGKMTLYDFFVHLYDDKKLKKLLVRDENLQMKFNKSLEDDTDENYEYFEITVRDRIERVSKRLKLMDALQKVSTLREAIPLPYELILDIVEYLNNKELDIFIRVFMSP